MRNKRPIIKIRNKANKKELRHEKYESGFGLGLGVRVKVRKKK
jgi:hypothetical protein